MGQSVWLLVPVLVILVGFSNGCMIGSHVNPILIYNETCYWEVKPIAFSTWTLAEQACNVYGGSVATIPKEHDLTIIGSNMER